MKISARNQLKGKVKSVKHGPVSTEVVISVANGVEITSVITESAAKELELKTGSVVYAVIKANNVIVAVD
ncbi:MAG: TOBE domain-containing protein [Betaproteobacteria bacterium]|nr:TOBE domain-containing protein [Betaproteobacteria bacterium]